MSRDTAWVVVTHAMLPNGAAHRLAQTLLHDGIAVGLCATPLPGAPRWREERLFPQQQVPQVLVDERRPVPLTQEFRSAISLCRFARAIRRSSLSDLVLVGCDPLSFLEAMAAFRCARVHIRASAAWFVDWSAHRLERPVEALAYRSTSTAALRLADVPAAISPFAADALTRTAKIRKDVLVLPNQALQLGPGPVWEERPLRVVYMGGLSDQQGTAVLLGVAEALAAHGVFVDIIGDGPATPAVTARVMNIQGVHFHGVVADVATLARIMLQARVGLALYDPLFPQYLYGDSLKIKDYLAAGMRVVSTLPTSVEDGVIVTSEYSVPAVVTATRFALSQPAPTDPATHPMLEDAKRAVTHFRSVMEAIP